MEQQLLHTAAETVAQQQDDELRRIFTLNRTIDHLSKLPLLAAAMSVDARPKENLPGAKPGPRVPAALSGLIALDEMWALIGNWAKEHARYLGETPPGAVVYQAVADEDVTGFPVRLSPTFRVGLVVQVADWLRARQEAVQAFEWAHDWQSDIDSNMRTWLARYPMEISDTTLPKACPECGRWAVRVTWSDTDGHYDDYRAECGACGHVMAERQTVIAGHDENCAACGQGPDHQNGSE